MITLQFTALFALIVFINLAWGLILPGWVIVSALVAYAVLIFAEFQVDRTLKEAYRWVQNKYSSGR